MGLDHHFYVLHHVLDGQRGAEHLGIGLRLHHGLRKEHRSLDIHPGLLAVKAVLHDPVDARPRSGELPAILNPLLQVGHYGGVCVCTHRTSLLCGCHTV